MEDLRCSFPSCLAAAQVFLLLPSHKQPLCAQHLCASLHEVRPVAAWNSVTSKDQLGSQRQRREICLGVVAVLEKMRKLERREIWKMQEHLEEQIERSIGTANRAARCLLVNSGTMLTEDEQRAIRAEKRKCVLHLAGQFTFEKAALKRLRQEVDDLLAGLQAELQQYIESSALELSPLASALAACEDLLDHYFPSLVRSELFCQKEGRVEGYKHLQPSELLSQMLGTCLRLAPVYRILRDLRHRISSVGNDVDVSPFQLIPAECRRLCVVLESEEPSYFYCNDLGYTVPLGGELMNQAYSIRAQVLRIFRDANDEEELRTLQTYTTTGTSKAVALHREGRYEDARQLVRCRLTVREQLRECDVSLSQLYSNLAAVKNALDDDYGAAKDKQRAWELLPDRDISTLECVDTLYKVGIHYFNALHLRKAEIWAQKAMKMAHSMQPTHNMAKFLTLRLLGEIYISMKEPGKAADYFQKAIDLCFQVGAANEPFAKVCAQLALCEAELQHYDQAELHFAQAIEHDQTSSSIYYGLYLLEVEKINAARSVLCRLLRENGKCLKVFVALASAAVYQENLVEALMWARRAYRLHRGTEVRTVNCYCEALADIEIARRNYRTALMWLDKADKVQESLQMPVNLHSKRQRALALLGLHHTDEAELILLDNYAKNQSKDPTSLESGRDLAVLGALYLQCSRLVEAEEHLERAKAVLEKVLPQHSALSQALMSLGHVHLLQQRYESAVSFLTKAAEMEGNLRPGHSNLAQIYRLLAWIAKERGNCEEAFEHYAKALQILWNKDFARPKAAETCRNIAEMCEIAGKMEEARYYEEVASHFL